jgi:hypothetical protein
VFLEGATLPTLLPELWPMALISLISLTVAVYMFRHRLT